MSQKADIVTSSGVDHIKDSNKLVGNLKAQGHPNPLGQSVDNKLLKESQSSVPSSVIGLPTADSMGSMCTQSNKSKKEATLDLTGEEHLGLEGSKGSKSMISDKLEPQLFDDFVPSVKSLGGSPLSHDSNLVGAVTTSDTVIDSKLPSSVMQVKKAESAKPAGDGLNQISSKLSEPIVAIGTGTISHTGKEIEKDNLIDDFEEVMNSSMSPVSIGKGSLVADPFINIIGDKKILSLSGSIDDDLKSKSKESVYPSSLISIEESEDNAAVLPIPVNDNSKPRKDTFIEPEFLKRSHQNIGTGEKIAFDPADADALLTSRLGLHFDSRDDPHLDKHEKAHAVNSVDSDKDEKNKDLASSTSSSTKTDTAASPTRNSQSNNEGAAQAQGEAVVVAPMMDSAGVTINLDAVHTQTQAQTKAQAQAQAVVVAPMMDSAGVTINLDAAHTQTQAQTKAQAQAVVVAPIIDSDPFNEFDDFVSADMKGIESADFSQLITDDDLLEMKSGNNRSAAIIDSPLLAVDIEDSEDDPFFGTEASFSSSSSSVVKVVPVLDEVTDMSHKLNLSTRGVSLSEALVPEMLESDAAVTAHEDDQAKPNTPLSSHPVSVTENVLDDSLGGASASENVPEAVQQKVEVVDDEDEWDDFEEAEVSPNIDVPVLSNAVISPSAMEFKDNTPPVDPVHLSVGTVTAAHRDHMKEAESLMDDEMRSQNEVMSTVQHHFIISPVNEQATLPSSLVIPLIRQPVFLTQFYIILHYICRLPKLCTRHSEIEHLCCLEAAHLK